MMLMPIGINAAANPCSPRPMITATKSGISAASTEPVVIATMHTNIISRLPNMSASLETVGVATEAVSNVMVTSHAASSAVTPKISGKSGSSGMTMVCCNATTVPHSDRIPMTAQVGAFFAGLAGNATSRGKVTRCR